MTKQINTELNVLVEDFQYLGAVSESVETRFADDDTIVSDTVLLENGSKREDFYKEGNLVARRYKDISEKNIWSEITNFYDASGQRVEKLTYFEDARQRVDLFENGIRTKTILSDLSDNSMRDWSQITQDFASNGEQTRKSIIYDDGSTRTEEFIGGNLLSIEQTDVDNEVWTSLKHEFAADGAISTRTVKFDNDVAREEIYTEGEVSFVTERDVADLFDWHIMTWEVGPGGQVSKLETIFDNGNVSVMNFEDGMRDRRIEVDASDNEQWDFRITEYTADRVENVVQIFNATEVDSDDGPRTIEVITGRVTTLQPDSEEIVSIRVLEGPAHGNLTVNPDNSLALVLTETKFTGAMSIRYEITKTNGQTEVIENVLNTVEGPVENGWGLGDHYMLETNANDDLIVETGENHRDIFVSGNSDALSREDIARAEGLSVDQITGSWLKNNPEYGGSESMALDNTAGNMLWRELVGDSYKDEPASHWLQLEGGYEYSIWNRGLNGIRGESELHPMHITSYGSGKATITSSLQSAAEAAENLVISNIELTEKVAFNGGQNIIFENVTVKDHLVVQNLDNFTIRNSSITDVAHEVSLTEGYWEPSTNRLSGIYASNVDGLLIEDNFFDHNGWADGYSADLSLDSPQPPSIFNHNIYIQDDNLDVTLRDTISMRGASFGAQVRSGGFVEDNAFIDNNGAFYVSGGQTGTRGEYTYTGNYSLIADNIVTSGQHLTYDGMVGQTAGGIGDFVPMTSLVDNIVTHLLDRENPKELMEKLVANFALKSNNAYSNNTIVYNWAAAGEAADIRDENVDGLDQSILDETTIQNFAAQILSDPNASIENLADYLQTLAERGEVDAEQIVDFFQSGFGLLLDERLTVETLRFVPNDLGEGVRWDNRLNWTTEDLPGSISGDSVDLAGNWVQYGGTTTIENLDMGDGGRLIIEQGRLDIDGEITTSASNSHLHIDRAGQLWVEKYTDSDILGIKVDGGRFANTGEISGAFNMTVTNGQAILATDAATFHIGQSSSLNIIGGDAKIGFDGSTGATAIVRMQEDGTLRFVSGDTGFGTIEEFRSGAFGEAGPNVASGLNMDGGSLALDLSVGTYTLGSTHTLIDVDELVGSFASVDVTGLASNQNAKLLVDYENDTVSIKITGSGNGNFEFDVIGDQRSADTNSDLWNKLVDGQPTLNEDPMPYEIIVNEELIDL